MAQRWADRLPVARRNSPFQSVSSRVPDGARNGAGQGHISLVGCGPGARDLLTFRAAERIAAADIVFYDRLVDPEVVALASAKAERVYVGKVVGAHAWPQERINAAICEAGLRGLRVVRLKSGDPSIFGRAAEELTASEAVGLPCEIVPGVTAASAAAASLGRSLTERGVSDTLVLATGMAQAGAEAPDTTRFSGPGTTTALYMSVRQAPRIVADLQARGLSADHAVDVAVDVSKSSERQLRCPLSQVPACLEAERINGCALILVTWPDMAAVNAGSRGKAPPASETSPVVSEPAPASLSA